MNDSEIRQYLSTLREHWLIAVAAIVLCVAAAAILAWTREPIYQADAQMFVSARTAEDVRPGEIYEASLASESRAQSYARIVSSPPVAEAVIRGLDLPRTVEEVQESISATVPEETVLIDVTVRDASPELAQAMAQAVTDEFPRFIDSLETADDAGVSPVEINVTSPPALPASPASPRKPLYLAIGALLGLVIGVGGATLREVLDRRIRDDESAEAFAQAPVLASVPHDSGAKRRPLVVASEPESSQAEVYRKLRTNLRVAAVDRGQRSLLVASAVPGEGKSLVAANLAFAFAQAGDRVVLIDADLRRPRLSELLDLEPGPGLSELLAGDVATEPLHRERALPLELLPSGAPPRNPSELLESEAFGALLERMLERAEVVIIDSPPLLAVSDAAIIARQATTTLMVARAASTRAEQLDAAADLLRTVGKEPVGTVLNGVSSRVSSTYGYSRGEVDEMSTPWAPAWDR